MVPTAAQLSTVLHDLALVAQGVRMSCLVDCCALAPPFAARLLQTLALPEWRTMVPHVDRVVALVLDSNVFFVNYRAFLEQKCIDLASQLRTLVVVDVSAHLSLPLLLVPSATDSSSSSIDAAVRVGALADAIATISDQLIDTIFANVGHSMPSAPHRVLELSDVRVSSTALAGIVLCYPVVYDLFDPSARLTHAASLDPWDAPRANCLSLCPLAVLQTFVTSETAAADRQSSPVTLLQEFSVPQCVLERRSRDASETALRPTLALLRATSKRQLARALSSAAPDDGSIDDRSHAKGDLRTSVSLRLDNAVAGVRVAMRTLDRVAL